MKRVCATVSLFILASACKEPLADTPHYKATVACNAVKRERASTPGGGTTNEATVRCVQALEKGYAAEPAAELGGLARCVLNAPTGADANACR